ncbi:MAG: hypothetical protein H6807_08510, partial [Planctomycetes bacterium]|nr:hypothetical protein [Planctomycetota bacterium]
LFTKEQLDQVSLPPAEFIREAKSGGWLVFDIRDTREREKFQVELSGRKRCAMDEFVAFLKKGIFDGKKVLVLDTVGREISWLHYYLAGSKVADFRFLKGGVEQWQKDGFDGNGDR